MYVLCVVFYLMKVPFLPENELPQNGTFGKDGEKVKDDVEHDAPTSSTSSTTTASSTTVSSPPPAKKQCGDHDVNGGTSDGTGAGASGENASTAGMTEPEKVWGTLVNIIIIIIIVYT